MLRRSVSGPHPEVLPGGVNLAKTKQNSHQEKPTKRNCQDESKQYISQNPCSDYLKKAGGSLVYRLIEHPNRHWRRCFLGAF